MFEGQDSLNLLNDITHEIRYAQTERIEREIRTLDEDTDAFNFHPIPFKRTFPGRWILIMQIVCNTNVWVTWRRSYISPCLRWTSTFVCGSYYNALWHLGTNFNTAFIRIHTTPCTRPEETSLFIRVIFADGKMSCQTLTRLASIFARKPNFTDILHTSK